MRCKKCGWPNRPGETTCSKCGSPLEQSSEGVQTPEASYQANQTVRENDAFGPVAQPNICPKCGYTLRPGLQKCPNCNTDLSEKVVKPETSQSGPRMMRRPTEIGVPNIHGTVNVWQEGSIGVPPSFVLSPIKWTREHKQPEDLIFDGEEVQLNRDNTDKGNMSITSHLQAVVSRKDNKWYIEDKSEQKTTFVQASTPHELHDGDIILLGNRLFIFHE